MQTGVVFPQIESPADPVYLRDYVQTAEALGYDYLLAYDHVLGANREREGGFSGPYDHNDPFHELFTTFSYMAALTERIHFASGILILPQRQTALVARQAAQMDMLSGGRLRLGIGIGWNDVEYEALNEDFSTRGKRSAEQVEVLNLLWTQPLVTYRGDYHTITDAGLNPMPVQRPIPVWFGGGADVVLRRMARLGAGWMPNTLGPDDLRPTWEKLRGYVQDAGRDPDSFGLDIRMSIKRTPENKRSAVVRTWQEFGATHLGVNTMGMGFTPQQHIDAIRDFRQHLPG